jgi:hypothetical protein
MSVQFRMVKRDVETEGSVVGPTTEWTFSALDGDVQYHVVFSSPRGSSNASILREAKYAFEEFFGGVGEHIK